jgi:pyruvate kinase
VGHDCDQTTAAVARSAALVADDISAKLIAVWCRTARTARWISKYQPTQPVAGLSPDARICRRLALCYGIAPVLVAPDLAEGGQPTRELERQIAAKFSLQAGDPVVIVGDPSAPHRTSTVSIHHVEV